MTASFRVVPLPTEAGASLTLRQGESTIRRSVLPGGIRVLTERMPGVRSVAVGAWIAAGSRDEDEAHAGSTHFLEHLLFKGTARRSALDIATAFDRVGGDSNAATAKDYTCYYARVLDRDYELAIDVIMDMVCSARIGKQDFELERGVILEELAMVADDPHEVVHEQFSASLLAPHPLARPIGGTAQSISVLGREAVVEHYGKNYVPAGLVITAAGSLDHEEVVAAVLRGAAVARWTLEPGAAPHHRRMPLAAALAAPGRTVSTQPIEQAHLIVGVRGLADRDPRRFALAVATTILGGGMSSRLFQEIREKRGLAYSTYAFNASYAEAGILGTYAACSPRAVGEVYELLCEQLQAMGEVTGAEVERAVGQIQGSFFLATEDPASRMNRLGGSEIKTGELLSFDEIAARYSAVTPLDICEAVTSLTAGEPTVALVGPETAGANLPLR